MKYYISNILVLFPVIYIIMKFSKRMFVFKISYVLAPLSLLLSLDIITDQNYIDIEDVLMIMFYILLAIYIFLKSYNTYLIVNVDNNTIKSYVDSSLNDLGIEYNSKVIKRKTIYTINKQSLYVNPFGKSNAIVNCESVATYIRNKITMVLDTDSCKSFSNGYYYVFFVTYLLLLVVFKIYTI